MIFLLKVLFAITSTVILSGGFAKVKLAIHKATGEKVAVKVMCKNSLGVRNELIQDQLIVAVVE